jgi:hypothetical protein
MIEVGAGIGVSVGFSGPTGMPGLVDFYLAPGNSIVEFKV